MSDPSPPSYEFGPFALDAGKRLLLRNGEPVPLAPKVLETLLVLIENRERVLSKDELLKQVWGDTIVEEGGLTRNVSVLRKTLGEKPEDHQYIVTVPARGYRFVAEVRERRQQEHSPVAQPQPQAQEHGRETEVGPFGASLVRSGRLAALGAARVTYAMRPGARAGLAALGEARPPCLLNPAAYDPVLRARLSQRPDDRCRYPGCDRAPRARRRARSSVRASRTATLPPRTSRG